MFSRNCRPRRTSEAVGDVNRTGVTPEGVDEDAVREGTAPGVHALKVRISARILISALIANSHNVGAALTLSQNLRQRWASKFLAAPALVFSGLSSDRAAL